MKANTNANTTLSNPFPKATYLDKSNSNEKDAGMFTSITKDMFKSSDSKQNLLENEQGDNLLEKINPDADDVEKALEKTSNDEGNNRKPTYKEPNLFRKSVDGFDLSILNSDKAIEINPSKRRSLRGSNKVIPLIGFEHPQNTIQSPSIVVDTKKLDQSAVLHKQLKQSKRLNSLFVILNISLVTVLASNSFAINYYARTLHRILRVLESN